MSETKLYRDRNLLIMLSVNLMAVQAMMAIAPAFPEIVKQLKISELEVGLLITAFSMPGLVLAPFLGVLADRYGRRRILVPSLFIFAIMGVACALARDFTTLLILRAVQGIGGTALGSINTTIIADMYTGRQRVRAIGLNASVMFISMPMWTMVGGSLALLGWYYPFALSILALPMGILALTHLRNPEPQKSGSISDYLRGTWAYLRDIRVIGLFAAGVLNNVIVFGAYFTYYNLYLNQAFGASSFMIGNFMAITCVAIGVVSTQLARINRRLSLANIIKLSFVVIALSSVLTPHMPGLWFMLVPGIIFGIGLGASLPSLQTAIASMAPLEHRAAFMSINATILRGGQAIGPPLVGLFFIYGGFEGAFYAAAGFAVMAPLVALGVGRVLKRKPAQDC
ncbi:MAG: MFS transporter [Chloroflexota bacterium]